ncbi:MAG: folylpolyglutamate synthase/dihydrofolate synthase family protein [candidate division WOR-3 bacterium]
MKVEEFLNSLVNYEKVPGYKYDLEAFKGFLKRLGSPQEKLKNVILIAGTKGKGSTATMINSCLIGSGYKVGLFTSPHLMRITERIRINNQEITEKEMEKYIRIIKPHINFKTRIGARTFFEVLATIAFMHFVEKKVDFAVLEVGLGGRLDATNVFNSHIPVITRIGYDHMNLLGNKLSEIAYEKAGIITEALQTAGTDFERQHGFGNQSCLTINDKRHTERFSQPPNVKRKNCGTVITIHQRPSVNRVLQRAVRERKYQLIFADDLHKIIIRNMTIRGNELSVNGMLGRFELFLPLIGRHQIENLQIALAVLYELQKRGFKIKISNIKTGIKNAKLSGRFEILSEKPLIIYDVAHNEDSFKALLDNLKLLLEYTNKIYLIFGCNKDKEINYAIKNIFPLAQEVLLVKANNPRAMEPLEIFNRAKIYQENIIIATSIKNALEYVLEKIDCKSVVTVFGSFYLYSDLSKILESVPIKF